MLGEAVDLLARAERLLSDAGQRDWAGAACHMRLTIERSLAPIAKRETEALEVPRTSLNALPPDACWQCDAPLGTTEECMTCAAKRREGQR
jgi:hypothetical protein